ncbi:MAG: glutamate--tRNA ligase [Phaeodactylibacter sp.]|nr:glutamate--tRNA ligase [Phaeodactylibacter sp.]MCB9303021.1 glutamate--tRNA ligase [Lewinellaceae bacterium]HQU57806.1 glutamate--tRNA ligase [Saprospiraceae bacterium]
MNNIRLRFAPSPTGALHIGGLRTALYNYLLAKKHNGTFILRIEDTDQLRYVPGAEEYIIESLKWSGLIPDEGPGFGGAYGPYRQSERKELYQKYTQQLLDKGEAYLAFDTPEELDAERLKDPTFKYDARVRQRLKNSLALPAEEVQRRVSAGEPYVVRLKVRPNEQAVVQDQIRGEVTFDTNELDDKVLMKAGGLPTYHLANIVDDHLMEITHVIRGEEWLSSTAHHVLLYRAFGWEDSMPQFAHLPLILKPAPESFLHKENTPVLAQRLAQEFHKKHSDVPSAHFEKTEKFALQVLQDKANIAVSLKEKDKDEPEKAQLKAFLKDSLFGKLSKRDGDRLGFPVFPLSWQGEREDDSFVGFREYGFLPEATINFLALLGWSPGTDQEIFSLEELIQAFSIEKIGKSGARFDIDKARWFNQQYILKADTADLMDKVRPIIEANGHQPGDAFLHSFIDLMRERAVTLLEFWENGYYFFEPPRSYDEKNARKRWDAGRSGLFRQFVEGLSILPDFSASPIKAFVEGFLQDNELKFGEVFPLLRIGLAGTMQGPAVFEMMELLGKQETVGRLKKAFQLFDEWVAQG